ncbi:MAG: Gfo/Idh/MocA family oxidoreductase [Lachnospiraceae bacterium]|nr:Gfo/Idh/MocA family oxidoreductase [Lachnospiraceae bacterium]
MIDGKLAVCVIGSGRAGMIHAVNYAKNVPGAMLAALVDPVEEVARSGAENLGINTYYLSHKQALENDKIDAYVVVSPTKFHVEIVEAIASRGKHILCEKPMAMGEQECDRMIYATEKNNVKLQIGFMRRFDAGFMHAKEIIDSDEIGEVVMVRSNTRGPSVPRPWMYDIKKSNGPLAEVNSHDIDTMRWFTGSEFKRLYAIGGNYRCQDAKSEWPDFYDNVVMTASFENGMQGMLDGAQGVGYAYDAHVEVLGTKGSIQLGSLEGQRITVCSSAEKKGSYPLVNSWRELFKEAYLNEDTEFVKCILNDTSPKVTGNDGKMAVKVVNAGNSSIVKKCLVEL